VLKHDGRPPTLEPTAIVSEPQARNVIEARAERASAAIIEARGDEIPRGGPRRRLIVVAAAYTLCGVQDLDLLPPLSDDECASCGHPRWRDVLGGYLCLCGKFEFEYHISSSARR
jgi:hypothetical protein